MKKNLIFIIIILGLVLSLSVFFVSKNQPQDGALLKESQIENPSTNEDQIEEITKTFDLQHLNEILKNNSLSSSVLSLSCFALSRKVISLQIFSR